MIPRTTKPPATAPMMIESTFETMLQLAVMPTKPAKTTVIVDPETLIRRSHNCNQPACRSDREAAAEVFGSWTGVGSLSDGNLDRWKAERNGFNRSRSALETKQFQPA